MATKKTSAAVAATVYCSSKTQAGGNCSRKAAAGCSGMCKQHFEQTQANKAAADAPKPAAGAAGQAAAAPPAAGMVAKTASGVARCQGKLKTGAQCTAPSKVGSFCGRHGNKDAPAAAAGVSKVASSSAGPLGGVDVLKIYKTMAEYSFRVIKETTSENADDTLDPLFYGLKWLMSVLELLQGAQSTPEQQIKVLLSYSEINENDSWDEITDEANLFNVLKGDLDVEWIGKLIHQLAARAGPSQKDMQAFAAYFDEGMKQVQAQPDDEDDNEPAADELADKAEAAADEVPNLFGGDDE